MKHNYISYFPRDDIPDNYLVIPETNYYLSHFINIPKNNIDQQIYIDINNYKSSSVCLDIIRYTIIINNLHSTIDNSIYNMYYHETYLWCEKTDDKIVLYPKKTKRLLDSFLIKCLIFYTCSNTFTEYVLFYLIQQ